MAQAHPRFKVHSAVHGSPALEHWWFKTRLPPPPPPRSFWPIRSHVLRRAPFLPRPLPSPWELSECPVRGLRLWFWSSRVADVVWTECLSWSLFLSRGSVSDADSREHQTRSRQGREELWQKRGPGVEKPLRLRNLGLQCRWVLPNLPPHVKTEGDWERRQRQLGSSGRGARGWEVLGRRSGCGTEAACVSAAGAEALWILLCEDSLYVWTRSFRCTNSGGPWCVGGSANLSCSWNTMNQFSY